MEFQHDKSRETLKPIYDLKLTAKDAWNKFIDFHEKTNPQKYWQKLKNIDIETEQIEIKEWIDYFTHVYAVISKAQENEFSKASFSIDTELQTWLQKDTA